MYINDWFKPIFVLETHVIDIILLKKTLCKVDNVPGEYMLLIFINQCQ